MPFLQTVRFAVRTARLGEVPRWNPARVEKLAERRLRKLLRHVTARSAFYRERYREIDLRRAPLAELPTVSKQELRDEFDRVVTDPGVTRAGVERWITDPANLGRWFRGRYAVSHTSGSQGAPLLIVQERRALEILFGLMSARANAGARPGPLEGLRRLRSPARLAIVAQQRGFYPSGAAFEFMSELVGPFVRVEWLSASQGDLIDRLNEFQPNLLVGYASVLDALALLKDRLRLKFLRQVANSSEQLTRRARERVQSAFGVPVVDHYGAGECLLLSDGCPTDGGSHINSDWAILEVVDEQHRPVPAGTLGAKVLVTNLANRVQPFIRYEINDRVALAGTACCCGSRLPRIERIEGRAADVFWYERPGGHGLLSGALFQNASDSLHEVRSWQAVQTERNRVLVRLELLPGVASTEELTRRKLLLRLNEFGLPAEVQVDVQLVPLLAPDATTGKLKQMISQVGPPESVVDAERTARLVTAR